MTTECIYCEGKQFKTFEAYAEHLLKKHSEDDIRVGWAREVLGLDIPKEAPVGPTPEEVPAEEPGDEVLAMLGTILRPELMEKLQKSNHRKESKSVAKRTDS